MGLRTMLVRALGALEGRLAPPEPMPEGRVPQAAPPRYSGPVIAQTPAALQVTGELEVGVEDVLGELHTLFRVRPSTFGDTLAAEAEVAVVLDGEGLPLGCNEEMFRGAALRARQIDALGALPRSTFTGRWLLGLYREDGERLVAAGQEADLRAARFRGERARAEADGAGAGQGDRVEPKRDPENARA